MADVVVGARLQLDANDGIKSLKEFKQQLKEAQGEVLAMSEKFGATSVQAREAAKRAAELGDAIADAKQLTDSFNPDKKFVALGQSLNGVLGGFTALTGAMGLLGVESEEVQKQLLKVQSAMALSQGLNQIGESINSFKTLGKTLVDTLGRNGLIGIAIAGVAALGAAIFGVFKRNKDLIESQKEYNNALLEARVEVTKISNVFEQARMGIISQKAALEQYNSTIGKTVGEAKNLNEAEKLLADNADNYVEVQGLKAKANFLLARSAEISGKAELTRFEIEQGVSAGFVRRGLLADVERAEQKAKDLESRVEEINQKIRTASSGFATPGLGGLGAEIGGVKGGKATTPGGKQAELEAREIAAIDEERLARQQTVNQRLAAFNEDLNKNLKISNKSLTDDYLANQKTQTDAARATAEYEEFVADSRIATAKAISNALGAIADLIGKQTAAGKALAIAQSTINMWVGVTEVLRAKSLLPEPLATISKVANIATIIATGLSAIKNIVKVQVPGGGGGSSPSVSSEAPLQPQAPRSTSTRLDADQLNRIGNATVRAFVLESDVTNNQQRIRRLNRQARL